MAVEPSRQIGFLWGATALAAAALAPLAPAFASSLPPCPFHLLTGLPCAGCGSTRAALALARLDLPGALAMNPLAAVAMVAFVLGGLAALAAAIRGQGVPEPAHFPRWLRLAAAGALAVNWGWLVVNGR